MVRTAVIPMLFVVSGQTMRLTSHDFHMLQTHDSFPLRRSHGVSVVHRNQSLYIYRSKLCERVGEGGTEFQFWLPRIQTLCRGCTIDIVYAESESKVNSVGKVGNKGVLGSKTWFLASKWAKMTDFTDFDHRFGIRIKNWTTLILGSNFDFWVEIFLSVVEFFEKLTVRFVTFDIEHPA